MTAYLDYAGMGKLRPRAVAAMQEALVDVLPHGSAEVGRIFPARRRARALAAGLLDCSTDEIAFVTNTSTGLHLVADGLDWRAGDEVVVFDRDFPANVHPWRMHDVRLVWVPMRDGGYRMEDVEAAISPATRLVAVSHVNFATGFRVDLDAVCALAHRVGALVSVDAVQSLGVLPLSVADTPVDFLAAGAHKWLCGPVGTGIFFSRREHLPHLRLPGGWFGFEGANDMLTKGAGHFRYDLSPLPTAARAEGGMYNVLGMVGLAETLAELSEVGIPAIAERVRHLTQRLCDGLRSAGCAISASTGGDDWSGIVGFTHPTRESVPFAQELVAAGYHVSHPDGLVRVAPHHWTDEAEVDAFLRAITLRIR
ncbi:aminotransferase class V-fold PLP-dependent enzyme [Actinokineospora diospyrosa]|uniref:Selenocysteine lyase/Cysteine desulfurase n=1 Tax=Actinokineospora diospyrosa TaxID=103728 RepID=A0ABT1IBT1_9PSEU|nr:aminotransferase class V-fold PLP-dependent enzyme [Actinokineospora diospyrosa]MCP2270089.1 Selenocysteine lyase/Cysteine desulfurase [Actinokineospora diospyrosa]